MKTINLTANFKQITYKVNVFFNPLGAGTFELNSNDLHYGDQCVLTIIPNSGYDFVNLVENDTELTENLTYSFVVGENRNIIANFNAMRGFSSAFSNAFG